MSASGRKLDADGNAFVDYIELTFPGVKVWFDDSDCTQFYYQFPGGEVKTLRLLGGLVLNWSEVEDDQAGFAAWAGVEFKRDLTETPGEIQVAYYNSRHPQVCATFRMFWKGYEVAHDFWDTSSGSNWRGDFVLASFITEESSGKEQKALRFYLDMNFLNMLSFDDSAIGKTNGCTITFEDGTTGDWFDCNSFPIQATYLGDATFQIDY